GSGLPVSFCGIRRQEMCIGRSRRMQAVRCREWGPPDVLRLEKVARRELAPSEVRIRVHAAGVNFADSLMVGGTYQVKPPFPFTPGLEAAGGNGNGLSARVIGAAGRPEKLASAREHGADEFIDYRQENIRDRVRALTDGKGVDVVFDPVGGDAFDQALRAVNWQARMLVIGFAGGRIQAVPANLILVKNISVIGVVWGAQAE